MASLLVDGGSPATRKEPVSSSCLFYPQETVRNRKTPHFGAEKDNYVCHAVEDHPVPPSPESRDGPQHVFASRTALFDLCTALIALHCTASTALGH